MAGRERPSLVADLSAQRTMALRDALARRPDVAVLALAHALILQGFYGFRHDAPSCLTIRLDAPALGHHAEGIEDRPAARHRRAARRVGETNAGAGS